MKGSLANESDTYRKARAELLDSGSAIMKENLHRGIDLLSPVWNILDLTPEGRGDWNAKLQYDWVSNTGGRFVQKH